MTAIQMINRNCIRANSKKYTHWWERNLLPEKRYYKILPDCNPNDQENSHKLQIWTASSKNRKMNFRLEIKLTVNSSGFRVGMWAKHKQSENQMVRRNSTSASANNCLHWCGEKFASWNKNLITKYCQHTMTTIQMIKRIRISSKFEQLPRKIGRWTSISK